MDSGTSNVPFINVEWIFKKIYDLLVYIKNFIVTGGHSNVPSGSTDWAGIIHHLGSWIVTILAFAFIGFFAWAVYIRVRIHEVDQTLDSGYKGHFIRPDEKLQAVNVRWQKIAQHFMSVHPNDWRAAIMDADVMLDELVTNLGYQGANLGEKLKSINQNNFPTLQLAWEAHKIRNKIAHEGVDYNLSEREKEVARKNYESVFRNMGAV